MLTPSGESPALSVWYVAFVDYGRNLWWHRFCKKGFRHCFAFAFDTRMGVWILFDPTVEGFVVRPLPRAAVDRLIAEIWRVDGRVLKCKAEGLGARRPRVLATCVTVLAHLLGLPGVAPLFPSGLYARLRARGAETVLENDHAELVRRQDAGAGQQPG
jgi:hypothetical protein